MALFGKRSSKTPSYSGVSFDGGNDSMTPTERRSQLSKRKPVSTKYKSKEVLEEEAREEIRKREAASVKVVVPETIKERTVIDNTVKELEEEVARIIGKKHEELTYQNILELLFKVLNDNVKLIKTVSELKKASNNRFSKYGSWDDQAPSWN